jgi:DNA-directed RNA polymerase specialized sigma24 family protein
MIDPTVLRAFVSERCTEREREAVQLVFTEGLGIRRAAGQLGITPRAVRDRLDRVRERAHRHGLQP